MRNFAEEDVRAACSRAAYYATDRAASSPAHYATSAAIDDATYAMLYDVRRALPHNVVYDAARNATQKGNE